EQLFDEGQRLLGRLRALHPVRRAEAPRELGGELVEHRLLVVHADDVGPHGPASGPAAGAGVRGGRISNEVRPGAESALMCPRCLWTICWAMPRPRPVPSPWSLVVKKGSKMRPRMASGIPGPVSLMRTATAPSTEAVSIVRRPTPFIAWTALW